MDIDQQLAGLRGRLFEIMESKRRNEIDEPLVREQIAKLTGHLEGHAAGRQEKLQELTEKLNKYETIMEDKVTNLEARLKDAEKKRKTS